MLNRAIAMFAGSVTLSLGLVDPAQAFIFTDSIDTVTEIDYFAFSTGGGGLTIDLLARDVLSSLDANMAVLADDGSALGALTGAFLAYNDDVGAIGTTDGSLLNTCNLGNTCDSFLHLASLAAGNYLLAVGAFEMTESDVRTGINVWREQSLPSSLGAYQITFRGDVSFGETTATPEPVGVLGLVAVGAIAVWRRDRESIR